jgi:hypothetical protein
MTKGKLLCCWSVALLLAVTVSFADIATSANSDVTVKTGGFVALDNGQIVSGRSGSGTEYTKGWIERSLIQFSSEFSYKKHLKLFMAVESQYGFSYPQSQNSPSLFPRFWLYPARVESVYSLFDSKDTPWLQFGFGYFPFTMNRHVRNLGEFMFRTGTYPPYIINNFNAPFTRLLGFRVSSTFNDFKNDLLFTSEAGMFPTQDFSLSWVGRNTFLNCFEIGGGISFAHLLSINNSLTSPTKFLKEDGSVNEDAKNPAIWQIRKINDTTFDTSYYTFRGMKPDLMFGFDPKPLLPSGIARLMGKDDGQMYGEVCVGGWKNYQNINPDTNVHYADFRDRKDRTFYSAGINLPVFKFLDVLSFETEYYPSKYANDFYMVSYYNVPAYGQYGTDVSSFKWSVYAKKTFLEKFIIIGQVARDHMRPSFPSYIEMERSDVLSRGKDWWWNFRIMTKF